MRRALIVLGFMLSMACAIPASAQTQNCTHFSAAYLRVNAYRDNGGNLFDLTCYDPATGNIYACSVPYGYCSQIYVAATAIADPVSFGSNQHGTTANCETSYAATSVNTGGVTTTTGQNCLPANAILDAVVYRITTTITTAASFTVGKTGSTSAYCGTQSTLTAGTTGICFAQAGSAAEQNTTAAPVIVTFNATPGAGAIRLIVYYHTWTAPTS